MCECCTGWRVLWLMLLCVCMVTVYVTVGPAEWGGGGWRWERSRARGGPVAWRCGAGVELPVAGRPCSVRVHVRHT